MWRSVQWLSTWIPWLSYNEDQSITAHPHNNVTDEIKEVKPHPGSVGHAVANGDEDDEPSTPDTDTLLATTTSMGWSDNDEREFGSESKLIAKKTVVSVPGRKINVAHKIPKQNADSQTSVRDGSQNLHCTKSGNKQREKQAPAFQDLDQYQDKIGKMIVWPAPNEAIGPSDTAVVTYLYKITTNAAFIMPDVFNMDKDCPVKLRLGCGEILPPGLEIGLRTMRTGERAKFRIGAEYGYGISGRGLGIRTTDTLYLEVELLKVEEIETAEKVAKIDPFYRPAMFSRTELTTARQQFWSMGKTAYNEQKFEHAYEWFSEAISITTCLHISEKDPFALNQSNSTLAHLYNNKALTCLKMSKWCEAAECTQKVLDLNADRKTCIKAAYLMAKAFYEQGELDKSMDAANRGLVFDRNSPDLKEFIKMNLSVDTPKKINESSRTKFRKECQGKWKQNQEP